MHQAVDEAIRAACMADIFATPDSSCIWPACRCVIQPAVSAALHAFIEHPSLAISYECRQTMLTAIDASAPAEAVSTPKIIGW